VVTNLKPAKIRGVESHGMLLAAVDKKDLSLLTVDKDIETGTKIS
jgi:methionyl-tRNA synthetase